MTLIQSQILKTSKKINYLDISKFLESNSITLESNIDKSEMFENINTLSNANINDISFFSNIKYLEILKHVRQKLALLKVHM